MSREDLLNDLVDANHILFHQGIVDAFGHVSMRDPERPDRFWISRSLAPLLVGRDDLLCLDLDGNTTGGDERKSYLERFIHAEIYRARPDVVSVVHSHSPSVIPFGVTRAVALRPICHMCGFIRSNTPVFEIREVAGEGSDLLVRSGSLGAALARSLGDHALVLMRGHGITVTGSTIRQAVFRSVYAEMNAKLQMQAVALDPDVIYLTDAEAERAAATNDGQIDRAWGIWKQQAGG